MKKVSILAFIVCTLLITACGSNGSEFVGYWVGYWRNSQEERIFFEITHYKDNQYFVEPLSKSVRGLKLTAIYKDGMLEMEGEMEGEKLVLDKKTGTINDIYGKGGFTKSSPKEFAAFRRIVDVHFFINGIMFAQWRQNGTAGVSRRYASTDGSTGRPAAAEILEIARSGFRPDPNVAFAITVAPDGETYIVIAGHTDKGSPVYVGGTLEGILNGVPYDANFRPPANIKLPATLHTYTCSDDHCSKVTQGPARTYTGPTGVGHDGAAKMK